MGGSVKYKINEHTPREKRRIVTYHIQYIGNKNIKSIVINLLLIYDCKNKKLAEKAYKKTLKMIANPPYSKALSKQVTCVN